MHRTLVTLFIQYRLPFQKSTIDRSREAERVREGERVREEGGGGGAADRYRLLSRRRLAGEKDDVEVWSHPALVGHRLYLRTQKALYCISLKLEDGTS